jgi:hypothetical protein
LKRSNWIEATVLPPAVAVLNTAWVYLWLLWSVRAVPPQVVAAPFSPLLLGLLLLCGFAVTRWALAGESPRRFGPISARRSSLAGSSQAGSFQPKIGQIEPRLLITLSGLALVFAAVWQTYSFVGPLGLLRELVDWGNFISPVFLGLVACAYLWFQGIQLGRSPLPQENLERAFYGGIFALGLLFAVNQLRPLIAPSEALTAALAFFATGLAGLALVSVENARRAEEGLTGAWPALNRYWLGTVTGVIGSILLTGLLAASLLSPQTFERLANAVTLVVDAVTITIVVLAGTLAFLLAWLLEPVFRYLAEAISQINFHLPALPNPQETSRQTLDFFARYPALNFARQGVVLGLMVAALVLAFWWAVRRFSRRSRRDADETRESIATRELLLAQLKHLLQRRKRALAPQPAYLTLSGANDDPRLIVRRAYQAMLEWAPALSLPSRRAGQTPAAYAETLRQALPEGSASIETLTGAYVQARYAAEAPSTDVARAAIGAINQLRLLSARLNKPTKS